MFDREIAQNLLKRVRESETDDVAIDHILDMLCTATESSTRAVEQDYYFEYRIDTIVVPVLLGVSELALSETPYFQSLGQLGKQGWHLVYRDPMASGPCVHVFSRKVK